MSTSSTSTSGGALTASTVASVGNGGLLPTTGAQLAGVVLADPGAGMLLSAWGPVPDGRIAQLRVFARHG